MGKPRSMNEKHASNIFCLGFDTHNSYIFSGGNDDLVIQHDLTTYVPFERPISISFTIQCLLEAERS